MIIILYNSVDKLNFYAAELNGKEKDSDCFLCDEK